MLFCTTYTASIDTCTNLSTSPSFARHPHTPHRVSDRELCVREKSVSRMKPIVLKLLGGYNVRRQLVFREKDNKWPQLQWRENGRLWRRKNASKKRRSNDRVHVPHNQPIRELLPLATGPLLLATEPLSPPLD